MYGGRLLFYFFILHAHVHALSSAFAFVPPVLTTHHPSETGQSSLFSSQTDAIASTQDDSACTLTTSKSKPLPPKVHALKSLDDFLDYTDDAPQGSLCVVKFYAKSCPLCKRIQLKYKKMAHYYQNAPIRFAEVEKRAHPELFPTLGVNTYPFIQIYRNGLLVAAHGTESDKTFEPIVNETIQRELMMSPEDWESFLSAFVEPIRQSTDKMQTLRSIRDEEKRG